MKYSAVFRYILMLAVLALPALAFADNAQDALFAKGNLLYQKGQYKEALAVYQQLVDEGYQSPAVYFNMGNASYKNDDIPSAVLYFEKAHKLAPGDDDINYNLKYVNLKTTDKIVPVPEFFLARWWHSFILSFSIGAFAMLSIISILLASGALIFYFFAGSIALKKTSFYISMILVFAGVVSVFTASCQQSYFEHHPEAVVFSGAASVRSAPADKSSELFIIHDGTTVNILDTSNGWVKISLANGNEGWIKQTDVKEI